MAKTLTEAVQQRKLKFYGYTPKRNESQDHKNILVRYTVMVKSCHEHMNENH